MSARNRAIREIRRLVREGWRKGEAANGPSRKAADRIARKARLHPLLRMRLMAGLSQVELAEKSGVPASSIVNIERGAQLMREDTVRKLAKALRVKPGELLED